ncbi:unnamed protein product [Strongylus vulgaris]|uniref:SCP domain-containing protein n=1 Tax=Strongylus vulgaris TaxID=40348 RepID=A0A3P7LBA0_STRVU|nr:unnamed protein product [Strongylus vulgaris]
MQEEPKGAALARYFKWAVEDWKEAVTQPLRADAVYMNRKDEPFANISLSPDSHCCAYVYRYYMQEEPKGAMLARYFKWAVEDWKEAVTQPLTADAVYMNRKDEPFANMIYNKSMTFGCAYRYCLDKERLAIACVYGDM